MNRIQGLILLALGAFLLFLAGTPATGFEIFRPKVGPTGEKHRPVVIAIDAQREFGDGTLWKIYVRASDPDGDLDKIQVTFSASPGMYAPDLFVLPKSQRKEVNGAILVWARLNGDGSTDDIYGKVEIRAEDRAGNLSEPKKLQFTVQEYGMYDEFVPPSGFDRNVVLGQVEFPLETSSSTGKS